MRWLQKSDRMPVANSWYWRLQLLVLARHAVTGSMGQTTFGSAAGSVRWLLMGADFCQNEVASQYMCAPCVPQDMEKNMPILCPE